MKTLLNVGSTLLLLAGMLTPIRVSAAASLTFTVTTGLDTVDAAPGDGVCADSQGQCSLRAAVMEANSTIAPDVIILPADTYLLTITGSGEDSAATGDLDILNTLTINGAGAGASIIDATALHDRVFQAMTGSNVTISGVTISNGNILTTADQNGGDILNNGAFSLSSSIVSGGSAPFGGGIFNAGTITVDHSTISGNHADTEGGGIANDNALGGPGVFTLNDSTVSTNNVSGSGGAGIVNVGTFTINNSTISANTTGGAGGGILSSSGSGIFLTLNSSKVTGNHADFDGGGIGAQGAMTLNDSEISGNTAGEFGGGITTVGPITLTASQVSSNTALDGGGIYSNLMAGSGDTLTMTDSTVSFNSASRSAGGLYASGGGAALARDTFQLNTAGLNGGGISVLNGAVVRMTNSTLSDNAAGQAGGGIEISSGSLNGSNLTIAGNLADTDKAGIGTGGGIEASGGAAVLKNSILALNIQQTAGLPVDDDCHGTFGQFSYDLVGMSLGCSFNSDHTLTGFDPMLNPLANNGGRTLTRSLQFGSPAIDAGNPAGCTDSSLAVLSTDQRGFPRSFDGNGDGTMRCDIGAYEYGYQAFIPIIQR